MKRLEKALKKTILALIKILFPLHSSDLNPGSWDQFRRILVFRFDNRFGNSILVLSLIQSIKRSLPHVKIDILMAAGYIDIYRNHADIDSVIAYNQAYLLRNPFRYILLLKNLRAKNYDIVFSSSNPNSLSVSQAIFARLVSRRHSVGFDCKNSKQIYSDVVKGDIHKHYAAAQVDLWKYFDPNAFFDEPRLYIIEKQKITKNNKLLFWLGATGNKILNFEIISEILQLLEKNKIGYELWAGPHDKEIMSVYPPEIRTRVSFLEGTIPETALFFRQFNVFCSPDTGPMHLAAALQLPLVQLFVESNATWYAYRGLHHFLVDLKVDHKKLTAFLVRYFN